MNVDAMIKHHQAVTEVITHAMSDYASAATGTSWNNACFAFEADAILCALSRAGFRILGPDEVDPVTVERCVEVAAATDPEKPANWLHRREEIAAAIRALSSPDHIADAVRERAWYFSAGDTVPEWLEKIEKGNCTLTFGVDVVVTSKDGGYEVRPQGIADNAGPILHVVSHGNVTPEIKGGGNGVAIIGYNRPYDETAGRRIARLKRLLEQARPYVECYDTRQHNSEQDAVLTEIDKALSVVVGGTHPDAGKVEGDGWLPIDETAKSGRIVRIAYNRDDVTMADAFYRDGKWHAACVFYRSGVGKPPYEFREHKVLESLVFAYRTLPSAPSEGRSNV